MGERYLIDSNVVIDYLDNKLPPDTSVILDNIQIQISVISRKEILAWPKANENQVKVLNDFVSASQVFGLDEAAILKAIDIRKNYRVKLPDAIIAATAIVNNLILLTRNISDFNKIDGLTTINRYTSLK